MNVITREWLDRAYDDLAVIEKIIEVDYLTNMVAYHSQQAIEGYSFNSQHADCQQYVIISFEIKTPKEAPKELISG